VNVNAALVPLASPPDAEVHLVAFSPAGAGGHAYHDWAEHLDPAVALSGVRLPGREGRPLEPGTDSVPQLAAALADEIAALAGPVAVFGHSYGALLAYAVAERLSAGDREPRWVGVSGIGPGASASRLHPDADDEALLSAVQALGEPAADPALLRATLPALRADLRAAERFLPVRGVPLRCPVGVFGGRGDLDRTELLRWRAFADGELGLRQYPGGHSYLLQSPRAVVRDVCADLRRAVQMRNVRAT
jgi:surfactin synthase thioesterase subunit